MVCSVSLYCKYVRVLKMNREIGSLWRNSAVFALAPTDQTRWDRILRRLCCFILLVCVAPVVSQDCPAAGVGCTEEGLICTCSPCGGGQQSNNTISSSNAISIMLSDVVCSKLEICGSIQQRETTSVRIVDHTKRPEHLNLTVRILDGTDTLEIDIGTTARRTPHFDENDDATTEYEFSLESDHVGILLLDVLVNGEAIPSSPVRVEVRPRDCAQEFQNALLEPDDDGECVCSSGSIEMGEKCVSNGAILTTILIPVMAVVILFAIVHVRRKLRQNDSVWHVHPSELKFSDPPEIVGRGSFYFWLSIEAHRSLSNGCCHRFSREQGCRQLSTRRILGNPSEQQYGPNSSDISQVANNWTRSKRTIPIPGARTVK